MREFFKGWRRKTGVLTLVMACVFAAAWVRSLSQRDVLSIVETKTSAIRMVFNSSGCALEHYSSEFQIVVEPTTVTMLVHGRGDHYSAVKGGFDQTNFYRWTWRWGGFGFGESNASTRFSMRYLDCITFIVPFWSIVIPLTLLSAWLLLSNPRPATAMKTKEHTPVEGR